MSAHLNPFFSLQTSNLNQRLDALRSENKVLSGETTTQQLEIESLLRRLESFATDIESASEIISGKQVLDAKGQRAQSIASTLVS